MRKLPYRNITSLIAAAGKSPPESLLPDYNKFPVGYRLGFPFNFTTLYHSLHIKHLLESEHRFLTKKNHVINRLCKVIGDGVLTSSPENWKIQKARVHEFYSLQKNDYENDADIINTFLHKLAAGKKYDSVLFKKSLVGCLVEINLKIFYIQGVPVRAGIIADIMLKANKTLAFVSPYDLYPVEGISDILLKKYRRQMQAVFDELDVLNPSVSSRISRSEILNFLVASVLTTAANILFILLKLAAGDDKNKFIEDTEYRKCFIMECLRLSPAVWGAWYKLTEQMSFDNIMYPAGTTVVMHLHAMHLNPAYWKEPKSFNPERFRDPDTHKNYFMPFGAGPHKCIGEHSSVSIMTGIILKFLSIFDISKKPSKLKFAFGCIVFPEIKDVLYIDIKNK